MTSSLILDIYAGNSVTSFQDAKNAGCIAVIHKASQGYSVDQAFKTRAPQIRSTGMRFGAYLFFEPSLDWQKQLDIFLGQVKNVHQEGDLPWSLDYGEYDLPASAANRNGALKILQAFEKESGLIPICYGATGLLSQYDLPQEFARYALWAANPGRDTPHAVSPWNGKYFLFQYAESSTGQIPGMGKGADINKFLGNADDLKKFIETSKVGGGSTTTNPPTTTTPPVTTTPPAQDNVPLLKFGSKGDYVLQLQKALKHLGYFSVAPTGGFYAITEQAVKHFQNDNGLDDDGEVGPLTRAKLYEKLGISADHVEVQTPVTTEPHTGETGVPLVITLAKKEIGVHEYSPGSNPRIVEYDNHSNGEWGDDNVAWCAIFCDFILDLAKMDRPRGELDALAATYAKYGIHLDAPEVGCIVCWSWNQNGHINHVSFCSGIKGDQICALGGNQTDHDFGSGGEVNETWHDKKYAVAFRRPVPLKVA